MWDETEDTPVPEFKADTNVTHYDPAAEERTYGGYVAELNERIAELEARLSRVIQYVYWLENMSDTWVTTEHRNPFLNRDDLTPIGEE